MRPCVTLTLAWMTCVVSAWWQDEQSARSFVSFDDGRDVDMFPRSSGSGGARDLFRLLTSDEGSMLIGGRNAVYNISFQDLEENRQERLEWQSSQEDMSMCQLKGQNQINCHNYMRVVKRAENDTIYACGTNAYRPMCRIFTKTNNGFEATGPVTGGVGVCPYSPVHNSSFIVADGEIYSATEAQLDGEYSLIYRAPLRTEKAELKQLNAPHFVGSLEFGDHVYFFFRETAVEYMNCGKRVYSRVARVCKKDQGGSRNYMTKWTSFLKARLNCSVPGDYPFYFDEIQSISLVKTDVYSGDGSLEDIIYATFTTPLNSIPGSAVCAFRMSDIAATFSGPFKHQENMNANWLSLSQQKVPQPRPGQCSGDSRGLSTGHLRFVSSHPLMDQAVRSLTGGPLLVRTGLRYRLTHLAVHPANHVAAGPDGRSSSYDVLYVATDNGLVLKAVSGRGSWSAEDDPVLVEELRLPAAEATHSDVIGINSLLISSSSDRLFVVTDTRLLSVPLSRCSPPAAAAGGATSCAGCVALRDPHCGWHQQLGLCRSTRLHDGPDVAPLLQNISHGVHPECRSSGHNSDRDDNRQPNIIFQEVTDTTRIWNRHLYPTDQDSNGRYESTKSDVPPYTMAGAQQSRDRLATAGVVYTAGTLVVAVVTVCVASLLIGFAAGWLLARRGDSAGCLRMRHSMTSSAAGVGGAGSSATRHLELQSKLKHREQMAGSELKCDNRYDFAQPRNDSSLPNGAKQINLLVNPTKDLGDKNVNSTADNIPVQKVRKMYL